ncbi:MAG: Holliday junction branch migration protein RuvA [Ignavibacteria bacterium]|nr:Holliday junction branch migration protein RuvA [Ignavibacteria bacterium]
MLSYIKGKLVGKYANFVEIECNGFGFRCATTLNTTSKLGEIGSEVLLYTQVVFRDNNFNLYGFHSLAEKEVFTELIEIPGIGPKTAIIVLSYLSVSEFWDCIGKEETTRLTQIPGIGKRTAERLIMELKEKVKKVTFDKRESVDTNIQNLFNEAVLALKVLGYGELQTRSVVLNILQDKANKDISIELVIKEALKILNKK